MNRQPASDIDELEQMIDTLRRQSGGCDPKAITNPRYLHYCNAIADLKRIIADLEAAQVS